MSSGRCLIGSELIARGVHPRMHHEIKKDFRILPEHNPCKSIFDNGAFCKINRVTNTKNISNPCYPDCVNRIKLSGLRLIDHKGGNISTKEICCESKSCKKYNRSYVLSGKISLGVEFYKNPIVLSEHLEIKPKRYKAI